MLKTGLAKDVINGCSTYFWKEKWATAVPLADLSPIEIPANTWEDTVANMWDTTTGW